MSEPDTERGLVRSVRPEDMPQVFTFPPKRSKTGSPEERTGSSLAIADHNFPGFGFATGGDVLE